MQASLRHFVCRLIPPRPTFIADMNEAERSVMAQHVQHWREQLDAGRAIAFGPVADPSGSWGLGLACVEDDAVLTEMLARDPAILANIGMRYEVLPMPMAVTR